MTEPYLGFAVLHERRLASDIEARDAVLRLIEDPSWELPLRYFSSVATPGHQLWRRPGMIPPKKLKEVARDAMQSESVLLLSLASSSSNTAGYRETNFRVPSENIVTSFAYGQLPCPAPVQSEVSENWVESVLRFFDGVGGSTGVIVAMNDGDEVTSECWGGGISRDGVLMHPFPEQHARMRVPNRRHLGTKYMRFPRWGTLVNREHVAQLGGVEAIERAVEPAVVRQLSAGVYFQLTSSVATAMSEEAMEKQRRFTALADPLLPPQRALANR